MAGEWRAGPGTDLADLLVPFAQRPTTCAARAGPVFGGWSTAAIPAGQLNSPTGSRRNVEAHYDLSNDLFAAFLDDTLTYSSALFDDAVPWPQQSLEQAQLRKVHAILDLADVRAGSRVLEIGTGWGTLAIEAARRGAHVTTLTLSAEQAGLAQARVDAAGLADSVDIRLQDYREVDGTLRRGRQRGDDRGGRRGVLADLLRGPGPAAGTRRRRRDPVDPDEPRAVPRDPRLVTAGSRSTSSRAG